MTKIIKKEDIPAFMAYYPNEGNMDERQHSFYLYLEQELQKGNYVEINGNISYVFVYIYKLVAQYKIYGYKKLSEYLIYLSELFSSEKKIKEVCLYLAYDCLLGLQDYDEYLNKTEPNTLVITSTHHSNLRLNIQRHLGLSAHPSDLLLTFGGRKTKFIVNNHVLYKEKIFEVFMEYENQNGSWFDILSNSSPTYKHSLFSGVPIMTLQYIDVPLHPYYTSYKVAEIVKQLSKDAENKAREIFGVPKIGEGWISETELFRKIEIAFPQTLVLQHGQPTWLGRQHFDIWLPHWNIAIEYHGLQHFEPVEFFGGQEAFEKNVQRDKKKIELAKRHKVELFIVTEDSDQEILIEEIHKTLKKRKIDLN